MVTLGKMTLNSDSGAVAKIIDRANNATIINYFENADKEFKYKIIAIEENDYLQA